MPVMTVINVCLLLCVVWLNYTASTEAGADAGPWLAGVTVDVSGCSSETGSCDERFHYPRDEWPHPGFTDWFSFPYANVPGSEITGMLRYPTPHNACSPVDPPPGLVFSGSGSSSGSAAGSAEFEVGNDMGSASGFGENIMLFAIVDDFSACAATDKINNLRVAGYSLMISYPLEDLYTRDDISNTDFPVVLVSQSFANSVINATLKAETSQISASVSAGETVQLLVAIALVAAIFIAVMIPVCIGVCICCCRYRKCKCRRNQDLDSLFEPDGRVEEIEIAELPFQHRAVGRHPPQYGELHQEYHIERPIQHRAEGRYSPQYGELHQEDNTERPIQHRAVGRHPPQYGELHQEYHIERPIQHRAEGRYSPQYGGLHQEDNTERPIQQRAEGCHPPQYGELHQEDHIAVSIRQRDEGRLEQERIYMNVRADIRRFNCFSDAVHCCSICLDDFQVGETIRALPCDPDHVFHPHCIEQWLAQSDVSICPVCRSEVEL